MRIAVNYGLDRVEFGGYRVPILEPKLRKLKSRHGLRKQRATGFELLRGNGGFLLRHESRT